MKYTCICQFHKEEVQGTGYKLDISIQGSDPETLADNVLKTPVLCSRSTVETVDDLYCFASLCCSRFSNPNPSTGMSRVLQSAWNNAASMENSVTAEYIEQHRTWHGPCRSRGLLFIFAAWPLLTRPLLSSSFKWGTLQLPVHRYLLSGSLSQHPPTRMIRYPVPFPFLQRPCHFRQTLCEG